MKKLKLMTYIAGLVAIFAASPAFAGNMLCPSAFTNYTASSGNNFTTNAQAIAKSVTGADIVDLQKLGCQLVSGSTTVAAATDPASTNDNTQGFAIGSLWVNSTGPKVWVATAVGTGAATWTQTGNSITSGTNLQAGASGTAGEVDIYPTTASKGHLGLTVSDQTGNTAVVLNAAAEGQASTITIPDPGSSTASVVLTKGTQTITGAITVSTGGLAVTTGGLVSKTTNDLSPTFSAGITANPVAMVTYGTCTVTAVNGGTCIILTGVASRTITVTNFDIVAAGSAATCTGVFLEDNNGTPVVVATLAAATLTSGSHNAPLAATLGVGFGGGTGLTVAKSLQLIKNGSDCGTTTAFTYAVTYTIQ